MATYKRDSGSGSEFRPLAMEVVGNNGFPYLRTFGEVSNPQIFFANELQVNTDFSDFCTITNYPVQYEVVSVLQAYFEGYFYMCLDGTIFDRLRKTKRRCVSGSSLQLPMSQQHTLCLFMSIV